MPARLTEEQIHAVVAAAGRAPSMLNTQPWRWTVHSTTDGSRLELRADPARGLHVSDPLGRGMVVSCGAALFNALVALRHAGLDPLVTTVPDRSDPRLLARIGVVPRRAVLGEDIDLFRAISQRRTQRGPFHERELGSAVRRRLVEAAAREGASLVVTTNGPADALLALADEAAAAGAQDERRTEETASWLRLEHSADGIALSARGGTPVDDGPSPVRDFDPQRRYPPPSPARYEQHHTVAVLSTESDTRADWLRAGQALERVLLTATLEDVSASFRTEAVEDVDFRWRIREIAGGPYPQLVIRLGFGEPPDPSGRRSVRDVLDAPEPS
jgi:nitroreductase